MPDQAKYPGLDACWMWTGAPDKDGYGTFRLDGKKHKATHIALMLSGVSLPLGSNVLHMCDNPGCVNPGHLYIGTHGDNARDREVRGRNGWMTSYASMKGRKVSSRAKLDMDKAGDIRRKYQCEGMSMRALASLFGVHHSVIWKVVSNLIWTPASA